MAEKKSAELNKNFTYIDMIKIAIKNEYDIEIDLEEDINDLRELAKFALSNIKPTMRVCKGFLC